MFSRSASRAGCVGIRRATSFRPGGRGELQSREALKSIGTAAAMVDALKRREVPEPAARVAAELGALAFKLGYTRWADPARDEDPSELATHTRAAFDELRTAVAELHQRR